MARATGPDALEGFYSVLSDFIADACDGAVPDAASYDRHCQSGGSDEAQEEPDRRYSLECIRVEMVGLGHLLRGSTGRSTGLPADFLIRRAGL